MKIIRNKTISEADAKCPYMKWSFFNLPSLGGLRMCLIDLAIYYIFLVFCIQVFERIGE